MSVVLRVPGVMAIITLCRDAEVIELSGNPNPVGEDSEGWGNERTFTGGLARRRGSDFGGAASRALK